MRAHAGLEILTTALRHTASRWLQEVTTASGSSGQRACPRGGVARHWLESLALARATSFPWGPLAKAVIAAEEVAHACDLSCLFRHLSSCQSCRRHASAGRRAHLEHHVCQRGRLAFIERDRFRSTVLDSTGRKSQQRTTVGAALPVLGGLDPPPGSSWRHRICQTTWSASLRVDVGGLRGAGFAFVCATDGLVVGRARTCAARQRRGLSRGQHLFECVWEKENVR